MEGKPEPVVKNISEALDAGDYFQSTGAEKIGQITPEAVFAEHEHYFIRKSSREVQCETCHWGLFIDSEIALKDGKLYKGRKRVI